MLKKETSKKNVYQLSSCLSRTQMLKKESSKKNAYQLSSCLSRTHMLKTRNFKENWKTKDMKKKEIRRICNQNRKSASKNWRNFKGNGYLYYALYMLYACHRLHPILPVFRFTSAQLAPGVVPGVPIFRLPPSPPHSSAPLVPPGCST